MRAGERIYDSEQPGFYAQRGKRGVVFRILADLPARARRQRVDSQKTIEITIGRYGDGEGEHTPKSARVEARRISGLIKSGVDPRQPNRPDGPMLKDSWADYRDDWLAKRGARPSTIRHYEYCFDRLERWHDKALAVIASDPQALKREHARLTEEHGKVAADMTLQFVGIVHRHARGGQYPDLPAWPQRAYVPHGIPSRADRGMSERDLPAWRARVERISDPHPRGLERMLTNNPAHDVYSTTGYYLGSDPDPSVRNQLARDPTGGD